MKQSQFNALSPEDKLGILARNLKMVKQPNTIFGPNVDTAKTAHRKLAKLLHPDVVDGEEAKDVFASMESLWQEIKSDVSEGTYDGTVTSNPYAGTMNYKKEEYNLIYITHGDAGDYYVMEGTRLLVHMPRTGKDVLLFENEATVMKGLKDSVFFEEMQAFHLVPEYITTLNVSGGKANLYKFREYGNIQSPENFFTLNQLAHHYRAINKPFQMKAVGWLWSRLNGLISFIEPNGIVHAGITPDSILIDPVQHVVIVVNNLHSSIKETPYKSFSKTWRDTIYPPEFGKGVMVNPSLDVYMAAKSLMWALEIASTPMPKPIEKYFESCTLHNPNARLNDAAQRLSIWKDQILLDQMGWPREFVPTDIVPSDISREFGDDVDNGEIDWTWFQC